MIEDRLMIWKFNHGRIEVVRRIYEKYKDDLVSLAGALLNDKAVAEDAVHDAFVSFIKLAGTFQLTGSLKGFLGTCVANKARNLNRSKGRRASIAIDEAVSACGDSAGPANAAILCDEVGRLRRVLGRLSYEQREVIMLHIHSGLKFKEIAEVQQVSINTAQGRYRYGLEKLRSLLDGEVEK